MKASQLKKIIRQLIKEQRSMPPNRLGNAPISPGMSMGSGPTTGGVTPNVNMAACANAISNAGRLMGQAQSNQSSMNENVLLTENIWKRLRGAIKKVVTNCGDLYDESGGPV